MSGHLDAEAQDGKISFTVAAQCCMLRMTWVLSRYGGWTLSRILGLEVAVVLPVDRDRLDLLLSFALW